MGASPGLGKNEFLPLLRPVETRMGRRAAERRARPILRPFFDATINDDVGWGVCIYGEEDSVLVVMMDGRGERERAMGDATSRARPLLFLELRDQKCQ
jgi:hypothetical protein